MHQHPKDIPVTAYFRLNGVNFSYCWRAGSTSIFSLALTHQAELLEQPPEECVLLLKNPIERFRSSHMVLDEQAYRVDDGKGNVSRVIMQPPKELYIDGFLDDTHYARSPHNMPQMDQHQGVKTLQIFRLEGSTHLAGVELPKLNVTTFDKPVIEHHPRYRELFTFFKDDIDAWNSARPLTDRVYPSGSGA